MRVSPFRLTRMLSLRAVLFSFLAWLIALRSGSIASMTRRTGRSSERRPDQCRDRPTSGRLRITSPTSTPPTHPAMLSQAWNKQVPDWSRIIPRSRAPGRITVAGLGIPKTPSLNKYNDTH